MIHLDYDSTKNLTFYLQPSLESPIYLCSLINYTTRERKNFIAPDVSTTSEMLQLTVTEVGTGTEAPLMGDISIKQFGRYTMEIYEQSSSTNLDIENATYLGDDELMTHKEPVYDSPPSRNPIGGGEPPITCNIAVTVSVTDETIVGANDGTATANDTGGQGTITYLWTTSDGSIPAGQETNQTATGLSPGTYTVLVTDDITAGCTATDSGTVEASTALNPDDLSNLVIWQRPDLTSLYNGGAVSDMDLVSDADSQTPATVDFTEFSAVDQPAWREASGDDLPYVRFTKSQGTRLNSTYGQSPGFTTIDVIEMASLSNDNNIWDNESGGGSNYRLQVNALGEVKLSSSNQIVTPVPDYIAAGQKVVISCVVNASGTDSKIKINNEDWTTGDLNTKALLNFTYGSKANNANSESGDFKQFEGVLYSDVKTDENIEAVVNGLIARHNITI